MRKTQNRSVSNTTIFPRRLQHNKISPHVKNFLIKIPHTIISSNKIEVYSLGSADTTDRQITPLEKSDNQSGRFARQCFGSISKRVSDPQDGGDLIGTGGLKLRVEAACKEKDRSRPRRGM